MPIAVAGGGYDSAARSFVGGNQLCAQAYGGLISALYRCGAMAGDDATSSEFGTAYDAAAREAVDLHADLVDAFAALARLTARSIDNHRAANISSVIDRPAPTPDTSAHDRLVDVSPCTPPSCVGGDNADLPDFWNHVVDHLQGFAWPNADTDRLRSAADTWRDAADDLRLLPRYCDSAVGVLEDQRSPEIPVALEAIAELTLGIEDLAAICSDLGQACDDYAADVEEHRDVIVGILRDLAIEAGASLLLGAAVGFFTVGLGAAAGATIAATRAAAAARKIIAALRALQAAAKLRAVARLTRVVEKVAPLRSVLARFKAVKHLDDVAEVSEVRKIDDLTNLEKINDWRHLPHKIDHTWDEIFPYKKGPTTPMEHIKKGHWPDDTLSAKSRFGDDITEQKLKDYVDEAVRRGDIDPADPGTINCDLGRTIGTTVEGNPTSTIRVHIRKGVVNSAYPVD